MSEKTTIEKIKKMVLTIEKSLDDKKAVDVKTLEVGKQTVLADYFIIATGTSSTHIRSLADETEFQMKEQLAIEPSHIEGTKDSSWILMDYDSVIVHIFTKEAREFYKLDKLWEESGVYLNN